MSKPHHKKRQSKPAVNITLKPQRPAQPKTKSVVVIKPSHNAQRKLRGRGDYFTDAIDWVSDKVKGGANSIANTLIGKGVDAVSSFIKGFGDYATNGVINLPTNSIIKGGLGDGLPMFAPRPTQPDAFNVRHRECISIVKGSNALSNTAFVINPGDRTTFPWLASIAQNFEQYQVHGMVFEYESTSSNYTADGNLGDIVLATSYNVHEPPYTDIIAAMSSFSCTKSNKAQSSMHGIECKRSQQPRALYDVRHDDDIVNDDIKADYDFAILNLLVQTGTTGSGDNIGRLWVTYDVDFYKPRDSTMSDSSSAIAWINTGTGGSATSPFGSGSSAASMTVCEGSMPIATIGPDPALLWAIVKFNTTGRHYFTCKVENDGLTPSVSMSTTQGAMLYPSLAQFVNQSFKPGYANFTVGNVNYAAGSVYVDIYAPGDYIRVNIANISSAASLNLLAVKLSPNFRPNVAAAFVPLNPLTAQLRMFANQLDELRKDNAELRRCVQEDTDEKDTCSIPTYLEYKSVVAKEGITDENVIKTNYRLFVDSYIHSDAGTRMLLSHKYCQ